MILINQRNRNILSENRFFTLFDMIKLDLKSLSKIYEVICRMISLWSQTYTPIDTESYIADAEEFIDNVDTEFDRLNLVMSKRQLDKVSLVAKKLNGCKDDNALHNHLMNQMHGELIALKNIFEDELKTQIAYRISPEYHKFLENRFTKEAVAYFVGLNYDMEEACKCMIFERFTASSFHLMRICEGALKDLTSSLGIECSHSSWAHIIDKLKKYADKLPKEKMDEANELRRITASVELVKDAWRNRIMHLEEKYNPEEVLKIFDSTDRLITEIAKKLTNK